MTGRKRQIPGPDGQPHDATVLNFNPSAEHWTELLVDDGSVVKIKLVVTDVYRLDDMWDTEGNPVYSIRSQNLMRVDSPDNLRRQPE